MARPSVLVGNPKERSSVILVTDTDFVSSRDVITEEPRMRRPILKDATS